MYLLSSRLFRYDAVCDEDVVDWGRRGEGVMVMVIIATVPGFSG